ncbi:hypothetical protein [Nesterenkonia xinjiangensis]|uniref:PH domain-containing protein n=1 Tax=Nesterenkonia xinjiangensis TaxID=225327 RepID=A0A7Z0GJT6_9MICC|nr:hypothetical protein [Nesterenkonia xinjiangensis]NYJ77309.1 hypothetical protein [Nesterenkonia xinjiangensis]
MKLKLVDGEQVVVRTRAHHRALIPALLNLLLAVTVISFLLGYVSRGSQPEFIRYYSHIGVFLIWVAGGLWLVLGTLRPVLRWAVRLTYLTTLRVVQKNLLGAPQPVVVPLGLMSEVQLKQSRVQSMQLAGDLVLIHGAYGQQQRTVLEDMPDVEHLHTVMAEELAAYRQAVARQYSQQPGMQAPRGPENFGHSAGRTV